MLEQRVTTAGQSDVFAKISYYYSLPQPKSLNLTNSALAILAGSVLKIEGTLLNL